MHTEKNELTRTKSIFSKKLIHSSVQDRFSRNLLEKSDEKSQFKIGFLGWASKLKYNFDPWPHCCLEYCNIKE